jgi:hypothetical protein
VVDLAVRIARSFPCAVVLGDTDHRLALSGGSLHWYEGTPANIPKFLAALTGHVQ